MPCITVNEATNKPADYRDDSEHITELEYYIRVFATTSAEKQRIASAADDAMQELGYVRGMVWDDDGAEQKQKVMRYKTYL